MTVDFVYKQRADNDRKWALRNAKLRMSRKLIFAAGLAHVFSCHLDPDAKSARSRLEENKDVSALNDFLARQLALPPLETIAKICLTRNVRDETARAIFVNYDRFLALLDDSEMRKDLEKARTREELAESQAWQEVRRISQPFHEGLVGLFTQDDDSLKQLTMRYGIF